MLAKPVAPQRFQRAGHAARAALRTARRHTVTQLEAAHREQFPWTWAVVNELNAPPPSWWNPLCWRSR